MSCVRLTGWRAEAHPSTHRKNDRRCGAARTDETDSSPPARRWANQSVPSSPSALFSQSSTQRIHANPAIGTMGDRHSDHVVVESSPG